MDVAYAGFPGRFKTITFISTGIHHTYYIPAKVLLVGGGRDHSAGSMPGVYRALKQNGTKTDLFWKEDETHFIFVNRADEIIDFLNRNIKM